ncbi:MAG: alpha/beta hydrolase [Myxococcota bacterium]
MPDPCFPGAVAPERRREVDSSGVRLALHEWGDPDAAPVLLAHGMWDHARGFDLLAPLLAGSFRVIGLDARGHGDSGWADAYGWGSDIGDIVQVVRSLQRRVHLVGHSKGGGQVLDAAAVVPERVRSVVSIDGFGPPPEGFDHPRRPRPDKTVAEFFSDYLDRARRSRRRNGWRSYPSLDDLVKRRRAQNPRLSTDWLRYFAFHAARPCPGGWRWKSDPLVGEGFGPFKVEWIAPGWERLAVPMLALVGSEPDTWGPLPEAILAERLAHVPKLSRATVEGAGHFVHMEKPQETAEVLLSFLDR